MRQPAIGKQMLARQCFVYLGMAGFITVVAAACDPTGLPTSPSSTEGPESARPTSTNPAARSEATPLRTPTFARPQPEKGYLQARPVGEAESDGAQGPGRHPLGISTGRDGLLYVPAGYTPEEPAGFVLLLHGAGGQASHAIGLLESLADANNLILLAPDSRDRTWDVIMGDYGPDVRYIEEALTQTFSRYAIDPTHVGVGGFSDGASYALSLGVANGDRFTHIMAFSPGFMAPNRQEGEPRVYISHGTQDHVLPINRTSRRIVPQLQRSGYDVKYHEFEGPHTVPGEITEEAVGWFTGAER